MSVEIKFLGHSAFLINSENSTILIDPFLSQNPDFKGDINEIKPDDILLTHGHADHLGDAIPISKNTGAIITAVFELANYCQTRGATTNPCSLGGKLNFEWGSAIFLNAAHSSSTPDGSYAGCAASILLEINGIKIYNAGDTGLHSDLRMIGKLYKPDIAILPIGGHFTLGIDEAIQTVKWLNCKNIIPMHYNTFPQIKADAAGFKTKVDIETDANCIIIKPGESVSF